MSTALHGNITLSFVKKKKKKKERKPGKLSSQMAVYFCISQAMNENFCCSTSLLAFGIVSVSAFSHFHRYIIIFHCCFKLWFSNDIGCTSIFSYLCLPSVYLLQWGSFQIFAHFLIGLLFICKSSLHILDNGGFNLDAYPQTEILSGECNKLSIGIYVCPIMCWWISLYRQPKSQYSLKDSLKVNRD